MGILTKLTTKNAEKDFPPWMPRYQKAFDAVKTIVTSCECLTTIDFMKMPDYKIFVTTDASDKCSGAVLSFSPTWETAHPVAFDSMTFKGAELNYPVHKKELLVVIWALKKWQVDLLGSAFLIYTDHKMLENFHVQKELSHQQAQWMEFRGLYCPPLIPAGIWWNPVNSRNSIGINFGTVACQIDKTIPAECGTEFTFRWNGSGNHTEGIAPEWEEWNRRCPNRASANADARFGHHQQQPLPQQPPPSSTPPSPTATTTHQHHPPLSTAMAYPIPQERRHHAMSPAVARTTQPCHVAIGDVAMTNDDQPVVRHLHPCHPRSVPSPIICLLTQEPGAMSPMAATKQWTTMIQSSFVIVIYLMTRHHHHHHTTTWLQQRHPPRNTVTQQWQTPSPPWHHDPTTTTSPIPPHFSETGSRCHVVVGNVAPRWWMTTSSVIM